MVDGRSGVPDWFAEKGSNQLEFQSGCLVAFGIPIDSRYSKAVEYVEMIEFARLCAERRLAHYVTRVFCDSKVPVYSVSLVEDVLEGDPVERVLLACATKTLTPGFLWPVGTEFRNNVEDPNQ